MGSRLFEIRLTTERLGHTQTHAGKTVPDLILPSSMLKANGDKQKSLYFFFFFLFRGGGEGEGNY